MSEEKTLIMLLVVAGLIVLMYLIYKAVQDAKRNEEIEEAHKQYKMEQKERRIKERKEYSMKWNNEIQAKFKGKAKYKTNKPIKVLVGDYTDSMAPITNSLLRTMGIETEIVPSASDVIDRITDGKKYDIIITNNTYPKGESGQDVLSLKEQEKFKTPIIVLTTEMKSRDRFLSYGFDEYIEKPLDEEKVKKVFTKFIKGLEFEKIKSSKSK
jgi:CheY-like chemotaxis protein